MTLGNWLARLRPPLTPRVFPTASPRIGPGKTVEEEHAPFCDSQYYPVRIGQILGERYQVVGKLGFGITSTVWLARDLRLQSHAVLKVFVRDKDLRQQAHAEIGTYHGIKAVAAGSSHPDRKEVRTILDHFPLHTKAGDEHQCLWCMLLSGTRPATCCI